mmetsp:Transcript_20762/g.35659  ORF Transcript_20762/g.35659 Transcript_20762/m.35659 type:complete len:106 (-) Transcript_20762:396-713(-)
MQHLFSIFNDKKNFVGASDASKYYRMDRIVSFGLLYIESKGPIHIPLLSPFLTPSLRSFLSLCIGPFSSCLINGSIALRWILWHAPTATAALRPKEGTVKLPASP